MKRWPTIVLAVITTIAVAIGVAYHIGAKLLQGKIVEALGPGSHVASLKVNWFTVELLGLRIDAPKGWPAVRTLEAERVTIVPDLRSLLSDKIRISSIVVQRPYLSMLRTPGKLRIFPSLTENNPTSQPGRDKRRAVTISTIELKDGSLELFDATVSRPPLKITMERIEATIRDVAAPAAEKTRFELTGTVKGIIRDGRARLSGWVGPSARNSSSRIALTGGRYGRAPTLSRKKARGPDCQRISRSESRLRSAQQSARRQGQDHHQRPGTCAVPGLLRHLHGAAAQRRNRLSQRPQQRPLCQDNVAFTVQGDTSNPNFSLNENLPTRIAASMAGTLGVSIINVAEGLGSLGRNGMEGAGSLVEGVGAAIKGLFGSKR